MLLKCDRCNFEFEVDGNIYQYFNNQLWECQYCSEFLHWFTSDNLVKFCQYGNITITGTTVNELEVKVDKKLRGIIIKYGTKWYCSKEGQEFDFFETRKESIVNILDNLIKERNTQ